MSEIKEEEEEFVPKSPKKWGGTMKKEGKTKKKSKRVVSDSDSDDEPKSVRVTKKKK